MKHQTKYIASYLLIKATLTLMILDLALSPLLKVKLLPDRSLPPVTMSYNCGGANAVVVDSEVTPLLEVVFSNLEGGVRTKGIIINCDMLFQIIADN